MNHQLPMDVLRLYEALRATPPASKADLKNYIKVFLGINVPDKRICPEHNSPMDYLWYSFSADFVPHNRSNADTIVWANRAGGKTLLAAIATLLDCIFKPHCQVRILAGSGEQASKMYEYLLGFLRQGFDRFTIKPVLKTKCRFITGSACEVLTQSPTSVRGQHIHKLRCDEIELFDEQVFEAAKFTTQSSHNITGAMEMISTMHRPYGLMQKLISQANQNQGTPQSGNQTKLFKWCIWETIEKCTDRSCSTCPLWVDCAGKAKQANGYLKIDDCITMMRRASRAGWQAEMLCKKPSLENVVFDEFDPAIHVKPVDYNPNLPLYRSIDFGFVHPFVCLWIQVDDKGTVRVIDEYVRTRATIDILAREIIARTPCSEEKVAATFCDIAGKAKSHITGTSVISELASFGIRLRARPSHILEGIELIRRAIRDGTGKTKLVISPACPRLIEALSCYHYPDNCAGSASELPLKDGVYDHPIDALRYFFINYTHHKSTSRRY